MGLLVRGEWRDEWYDTEASGGEFVRTVAGFRSWVTPDGSPGPSGEGGFAAEPGRYRLYVSLACPWAHRTLLARALEGLESMIPISVVHWYMGAEGWTFEPGEGVVPDPELGATRLHQIYTAARPDFTGHVTVPVLWDTRRRTIVNNESSEILRMFDTAFDDVGARGLDLYPEALRADIDATNELVYDAINNGVYKAGFATRQEVYERHARLIFVVLAKLEARLEKQRWLCGDRFTEADIRLFPTLLRFDPVYHGHFKCNLRRIQDYPHLSGYLRDIYQLPGVAETVQLEHAVRHYYGSHDTINPTRIVPIGRGEELSRPHGREALGLSPYRSRALARRANAPRLRRLRAEPGGAGVARHGTAADRAVLRRAAGARAALLDRHVAAGVRLTVREEGAADVLATDLVAAAGSAAGATLTGERAAGLDGHGPHAPVAARRGVARARAAQPIAALRGCACGAIARRVRGTAGRRHGTARTARVASEDGRAATHAADGGLGRTGAVADTRDARRVAAGEAARAAVCRVVCQIHAASGAVRESSGATAAVCARIHAGVPTCVHVHRRVRAGVGGRAVVAASEGHQSQGESQHPIRHRRVLPVSLG